MHKRSKLSDPVTDLSLVNLDKIIFIITAQNKLAEKLDFLPVLPLRLPPCNILMY